MLYKKVLRECLEVSKGTKVIALEKLNHHNTLLIRGEARQGKTRLLNEMVYVTPRDIPINRFILTNRDNKVPYQTIQIIFAKALGLTEMSTEIDRQSKILLRLAKLDVPDVLCALNPVFSVHFDQSVVYINLTPERKQLVLKKLIKQLCQAVINFIILIQLFFMRSFQCFSTFWVIAIDDSEFIDDESWALLPAMLDLDIMLIVMTMGAGRILSAVAEETLKHKRIREISLDPIDKWYHAGLACQTLDVTAIPPELEKVIQSRSNGNPGWVENFLVSLIQAGGLIIRSVDRSDIIELGLVAPPLSMMQRLPEKRVNESDSFSSEGNQSTTPNLTIDGWEMYQYSYKVKQYSLRINYFSIYILTG